MDFLPYQESGSLFPPTKAMSTEISLLHQRSDFMEGIMEMDTKSTNDMFRQGATSDMFKQEDTSDMFKPGTTGDMFKQGTKGDIFKQGTTDLFKPGSSRLGPESQEPREDWRDIMDAADFVGGGEFVDIATSDYLQNDEVSVTFDEPPPVNPLGLPTVPVVPGVTPECHVTPDLGHVTTSPQGHVTSTQNHVTASQGSGNIPEGRIADVESPATVPQTIVDKNTDNELSPMIVSKDSVVIAKNPVDKSGAKPLDKCMDKQIDELADKNVDKLVDRKVNIPKDMSVAKPLYISRNNPVDKLQNAPVVPKALFTHATLHAKSSCSIDLTVEPEPMEEDVARPIEQGIIQSVKKEPPELMDQETSPEVNEDTVGPAVRILSPPPTSCEPTSKSYNVEQYEITRSPANIQSELIQPMQERNTLQYPKMLPWEVTSFWVSPDVQLKECSVRLTKLKWLPKPEEEIYDEESLEAESNQLSPEEDIEDDDEEKEDVEEWIILNKDTDRFRKDSSDDKVLDTHDCFTRLLLKKCRRSTSSNESHENTQGYTHDAHRNTHEMHENMHENIQKDIHENTYDLQDVHGFQKKTQENMHESQENAHGNTHKNTHYNKHEAHKDTQETTGASGHNILKDAHDVYKDTHKVTENTHKEQQNAHDSHENTHKTHEDTLQVQDNVHESHKDTHKMHNDTHRCVHDTTGNEKDLMLSAYHKNHKHQKKDITKNVSVLNHKTDNRDKMNNAVNDKDKILSIDLTTPASSQQGTTSSSSTTVSSSSQSLPQPSFSSLLEQCLRRNIANRKKEAEEVRQQELLGQTCQRDLACSLCTETFEDINALVRHIRHHPHLQDSPTSILPPAQLLGYRCPLCWEKFPSRSILVGHMLHTCQTPHKQHKLKGLVKGTDVYYCEKCLQGFPSLKVAVGHASFTCKHKKLGFEDSIEDIDDDKAVIAHLFHCHPSSSKNRLLRVQEFRCPACLARFPSVSIAEGHLQHTCVFQILNLLA